MVGADLDDALPDVIQRLDEADAANEILDAVDLQRLGADIDIGPLHRAGDRVEGYPVGAHGGGIDIHLVLADVAADRADFGDPIGRQQRIASDPILGRA